MRVEPLMPDSGPATIEQESDAGGFARALDGLSQVLGSANRAEDNFANGAATLETAVYERARADVALSVATAAATRVAQAVQSVLNMQV